VANGSARSCNWRNATAARSTAARSAKRCAFIVAAPGKSVDLDALRALATDRLARFKVPRHFLIVDESAIPTTASGRARKFLLAELAIKMLGS